MRVVTEKVCFLLRFVETGVYLSCFFRVRVGDVIALEVHFGVMEKE